MKKLPIGIQTFSELVDPAENYIYVDKTRALYNLTQAGKYYFLSRPRRFGKSVLLSTLGDLFAAKKKLFKGLYIEKKWDWDTRHPVIKISFGGGQFDTEENFNRQLARIMEDNQERLAINCAADKNDAGTCFHNLVKKAFHKYGEKVVILIDEYDKPILDHITNKTIARVNLDKLKGFYGIIKDLDEYLKFVLITGVSKFAKMNLFSGLNNLQDITLNLDYATICGYTHAEVENSFVDHLHGVDRDKLQEWYNGYNYFAEALYNPFDILLFFANAKEYRPYWWSTGNPGFLIDLLKQQQYYLPEVENYIADDIILDTFDVDHIDLVALLWQTGYLTFKSKQIAIDGIEYHLKVPNKEIQISLNNLFIQYLTSQSQELRPQKRELYNILAGADLSAFRQNLASLFAGIPYQNYANKIIDKYEGYYASVLYAYIASLGIPFTAEDVSSKGRVDMSVQLPDKVYIIEFKVNQ
ncbi:MAG: AAA family ATPase, partial [Pseudomonadota bacterium]|nr:AAA family ATPase [Pseudomonadota bacterium]